MLSRDRRRAGGDAGFTLVELLISVVILGVISFPLGEAVIGYLRNTASTAARLSESHDAQIAGAWFAKDVRAVGVRDYTSSASAFYPLTQSIETGIAATGGLYPCGAPGDPAAVVRLAWDDFSGGAGSAATQTRVAYVVENGTELHRVTCTGSATPTSDVTLSHHLVSPFATVTCTDGAGAPVSCTAAAVPAAVTLTLTIHDTDSPSTADYTATLTGQRRQS